MEMVWFCSLTASLYPVLGHQPLLVNIDRKCSYQFCQLIPLYYQLHPHHHTGGNQVEELLFYYEGLGTNQGTAAVFGW